MLIKNYLEHESDIEDAQLDDMLDKDFNTELLIARRRKRWKAKEEELRAESRNGKCADQEDSAGLSLQVGWYGRWLDACVIAWLVGCVVGYLGGWVGFWVGGWLVAWLCGWLLGYLVGWMFGCLVGCLDHTIQKLHFL